MADSLTQEKVREAVAYLEAWGRAYDDAHNEPVNWCADEDPAVTQRREAIRTLLAAYTRMETDMAEARRLMEPFEEISTRYPREPDHANVEMFVGLAPFRALAAFYNKGEE